MFNDSQKSDLGFISAETFVSYWCHHISCSRCFRTMAVLWQRYSCVVPSPDSGFDHQVNQLSGGFVGIDMLHVVVKPVICPIVNFFCNHTENFGLTDGYI